MKHSRAKYQRQVLAVEDALTLSRDLNTKALATAVTLCNELRLDYSAHLADQGASAGEHIALHTAGLLASPSVVVSNLTNILAFTNDLTAKYTLHNADAAATSPTYHVADVGGGNALDATTAVTKLADALTRLNDIKAKYNLHEADATGHRTGNKHPVAAADVALGTAVTITDGMSEVRSGDLAIFNVLNDGTGNVTGVSAVPGDGKLVLTFSADPQDAIVGYAVFSAQ